MTARYVLTSTCLNFGSMSLTQSLRSFIKDKETVSFKDEDGETFEARVNLTLNRIEGLGHYYAKRRLGVNEKIMLSFEDGVIQLEALNAAAKPPKARQTQSIEPEKPSKQPEPTNEKRIKVTPYPAEVLFPQKTNREAPQFAQDLEALGLVREPSGPPWVFRAVLGRRTFSVALARFGEMEAKELLAFRGQGRMQYVAIVAGESSKTEAMAEVNSVRPSGLSQLGLGYVSPEALQRLVKLKGAFPLGALDLERLLREGRVDLENIQGLEREISSILGERGAFSAVLTLLSEQSPQQVFMIGDLMPSARELNLEADHLQNVLETLSSPPFLLLKRLSPGEFLMRQSVDSALSDWVEYADVMHRRLEGIAVDKL